MDKLSREFFGRAKAISLTKGEKKQCLKELKAFARGHSVREQAQKCHKEWMISKKQFVGKAQTAGLTTKEKESAFNVIKAFMDKHPIGAKEKTSPWWENFFSSIYFYVPATAVILLLVVARGEYEQHPWKKSISPVRESVTSPLERKELIHQLDEDQDQANEDGETDQMFIREPDWMGEGDLSREWDDEGDLSDVEQDPSLFESEADYSEDEGDDPLDSIVEELSSEAEDTDDEESVSPAQIELPRRRGRGGVVGDGDEQESQGEAGAQPASNFGEDANTSEEKALEGEVDVSPQEGVVYGSEPTGTDAEFAVPVEGIEDIELPSVVNFSSSDGATNVSVTPTITITFSEPVVAGEGTVIVQEVGGNIISTQISGVGTTNISIAPSSPLSEGTTYQVEVPAGAFKDEAGNPSDAAIWSFTTKAPLETYDEETGTGSEVTAQLPK